MTYVPLVIIGAGINGLCLAKQIGQRWPSLGPIVLEQEDFAGEHTTGRNSGVLHAGIYYPTNSLKHILCLRGNQLWEKLGNELNVPIQRCGKFIIANKTQEEILNQVYEQSRLNNVPNIKYAGPEQLVNLKKYADVSKAIYSASTGIIDVSGTMRALELSLPEYDAHLIKKCKVLNINHVNDKFHLETTQEEITCSYLINAGGLFSIENRLKLNLTDLTNYYVKGNYIKTTHSFFKNSLIYPVPLPQLKGLGIHSLIDTDGILRFGPNTEDVQEIDYNISNDVIEKMLPAIKTQFFNIDEQKISLDYCGIRPKIIKDDKLYSDFWIKGHEEINIENYIELCGIESPGLTAAPAIAEYIVNKYLSTKIN